MGEEKAKRAIGIKNGFFISFVGEYSNSWAFLA
jgi:hypothetical protein